MLCRSDFGGRPPSAKGYRPPSGAGMRPASGARGRMAPPSCILVKIDVKIFCFHEKKTSRLIEIFF